MSFKKAGLMRTCWDSRWLSTLNWLDACFSNWLNASKEIRILGSLQLLLTTDLSRHFEGCNYLEEVHIGQICLMGLSSAVSYAVTVWSWAYNRNRRVSLMVLMRLLSRSAWSLVASRLDATSISMLLPMNISLRMGST